MSTIDFDALHRKVEREFPVRMRLAKMLGWKYTPFKGGKPGQLDDQTLAELYLAISLDKPDLAPEALSLIREVTRA